MQYGAFIGRVQERGGLRDRGRAEEAARATLETLGERLSEADAADVAAQLPVDLAAYVERHASQPATPSEFDADDFYRKVAERHGGEVTLEVVREHVRAVMTTLREAISEGEFTTLLLKLPEGYGDLFR